MLDDRAVAWASREANGEVFDLIPMDEPVDGEVVRASIVAAHGQLFIRTTRKLYCVGKGQ